MQRDFAGAKIVFRKRRHVMQGGFFALSGVSSVHPRKRRIGVFASLPLKRGGALSPRIEAFGDAKRGPSKWLSLPFLEGTRGSRSEDCLR